MILRRVSMALLYVSWKIVFKDNFWKKKKNYEIHSLPSFSKGVKILERISDIKEKPGKNWAPRGGNHDKNLKFFHRVGVQPTIKWIKATQLFKIFLALLKENWWGCTGSNRVHKKFKNQNRLGLRSTQFINRFNCVWNATQHYWMDFVQWE